MPAIHTTRMTATQFLQLGEDPPGIRLELVDGEIEMSPSPLPRHSRTILRLSQLLMNHTDEVGAGEVFSDIDVIFDTDNVRRPDLFYYGPQHGQLPLNKALDIAPDLAVEVISPSSETIDRDVKFKLYRKHGVRWYWLIDPANQTFAAFDLKQPGDVPTTTANGQASVTTMPFPELEIQLGRIWR